MELWRHRKPSCPKQHQGNFILCSVREHAEFHILSSAWWLCFKGHGTPPGLPASALLSRESCLVGLDLTFCLHRPLSMHPVVTLSQALAFQSLVAQWSINWCSCRANRGAKKMTGSFTGQWKAKSTRVTLSSTGKDGMRKVSCPKVRLKGAPRSPRQGWEADTPSGSCCPCRQPSWAGQGLTDAHQLSRERLVCAAASCWGMLTSSGTELENLEQKDTSAKSAICYMWRTSWCLLSPSLDAHSFACSFSKVWLQPTLSCDCYVPLAAFRLATPYAAPKGARRQIFPGASGALRLSMQSNLCAIITACFPPPANPMGLLLAVCWWHPWSWLEICTHAAPCSQTFLTGSYDQDL